MNAVEVYLDQWIIDQAMEDRRLYPRSFRPSMQCPVARAIANHLQVDGVEVGEGGYFNPFGIQAGSHNAGNLIQAFDYGEAVGLEPTTFLIWPRY